MISEKQLEEYKTKALHPHILWMLNELHKLEGDKYNRWLGFIQGYLWTNNIYTIEQLREHNKQVL